MSNSIWGPRALAKFEGIASSESKGKNYGARAGLKHARESNRPDQIRAAFKHGEAKKFTPSSVQDSTHLSPEALELMNAMSEE